MHVLRPTVSISRTSPRTRPARFFLFLVRVRGMAVLVIFGVVLLRRRVMLSAWLVSLGCAMLIGIPVVPFVIFRTLFPDVRHQLVQFPRSNHTPLQFGQMSIRIPSFSTSFMREPSQIGQFILNSSLGSIYKFHGLTHITDQCRNGFKAP